ncbi:hypothetical protein GobsT_43980 [Gemmata obscuriglobus]|uniref:Uncharacterized protein n=1 Tax=Gemmata obscuriglobus TaxID=114 RepID=A0A2Z3GZY1_9BACT|nr:hypothetical protein C1280_11775 [Gemmata obscuriglobus]QEG29600.1 hypothetical protein GobsT_43980 [Gemmata obscuriglobus]VTS08881.1 unnamed protein product [Gemmata obscuriglobus UQM 2246]
MIVYVFNRRELKSPLVVAAGLVAFAVWRSEWVALVGLPLVYVGWCGCAPNMNLANGCLPALATGTALAFGATVGSAGVLVAAGACGVTWVVASAESAWRCWPVEW